jgi:hypothetical protein
VSFHAMVHADDRAGDLTTTWCPKVEVLEAAEPLVKAAVARAKRIGGRNLRIEIYDDLACRLAFAGRVK